MAAVDATEVVLAALAPYDIPSTPWSAAEKAEPAEKVLDALFTRAGIDGPGTIALTRDEEGRVVLGVAEQTDHAWLTVDGGNWCNHGSWDQCGRTDHERTYYHRLVPVGDDEEGGTMDDATRGRLRGLVAQAIWVADEGPRRADEWWDAGEHEAVRAACFKRADAVLDALGVEALGHKLMSDTWTNVQTYRLRGIEEGDRD